MMNADFVLFYEKHVASEVLADALGKNGKDMLFKSMAGIANKVSQ
jgi:hypothetical protein